MSIEQPAWPPHGAPTWGPPPDDPLIPAGLEAWFGRSFAALRRSVGRIAQVWLLVLVPMVPAFGLLLLASFEAEPDAPTVALLVLALLVAAFFGYGGQAASVFVLVTDAAGQRMPIRDALRFGTGRALPVFGWGLLAGVAVLVGLVLLIVPGAYLWVIVAGTLTCVVCVERVGPRRCLELVRGRWWPTAGRVVLNSAIVGCLQIPIQLVMLALTMSMALLLPTGGDPSTGAVITLGVLGAVGLLVVVVSVALAAAASTAMQVVTYAELRWRENPAVTTATLAAELTG